VRNCIRMYGDGVDGKFIVCSEEPALGEAICFRCTECSVSTWSKPDRKIVFARQRADTVDVVAMLMSDQDSGE